MNIRDFVITGFDSILYVNDKKGQCSSFESRYASCFIVTVSGKISFSSKYGSVVSERGCPVFIPEGLSYENRCIEEATSYVFNFHTAKSTTLPFTLSDIGENTVKEFYKSISKAVSVDSDSSHISVLKELYELAELLFAHTGQMSETEKIVSDALSYMSENCAQAGLNIKTVAEKCFVSEIYLRRLFAKYKGTTPFKALTEIRMKKAKSMVYAKRPVKEIAASVGYSDIYQFSRAYKSFYGYPPSKG